VLLLWLYAVLKLDFLVVDRTISITLFLRKIGGGPNGPPAL